MNHHSAKEDEIDLLELLGILWRGKWLILLTAAFFGTVAFAWLRVTSPTWQADLLLKVERKSGGIGTALLGDLGGVIGNSGNESDAQIEIIKSRSILGQTVDQFDLEKQLSRPISWQEIIEPKKAIQLSKVVFRLTLPDHFNRQFDRLTLYVEADGLIELRNNDALMLSGNQGELLQGNGYQLFFDSSNMALDGEKFDIIVVSQSEAIDKLRQQLSISALDKKGTLLEMRLTGQDPYYAEQLLNNIADNYVQKTAEENVEKFAQGVSFIEDQLPSMRARLEKAENALSDYQIKNGTVDLGTEGEDAIRALAQVEGELTNLELKENELRTRYTTNHPSLQSLLRQQETLRTRKTEIERRLVAVPEVAQGFVRLKRDVEVNQSIYLQLLSKLQELNVLKASTVGGVQIIDQAQATAKPIAPKKALAMVLAILAGIMLSALTLLLRHLMHNRIQTIEDVTENTDLTVVATVPESKKQLKHERLLQNHGVKSDEESILSIANPQDLSIEALRSLRTNLHFTLQDRENNVLLISGPTENVGKSFISTNLAVLLSQVGKRVALVNADLRKGYLDLQFSLDEDKVTLTQYLQQKDLAPESCVHQTKIDHLSFIPCGDKPKNPAEILSSTKMTEFILYLKKYYDIVLVDTPPILPVSDAQHLTQYAKTILLVTRFNESKIRELELAKQKIASSNAEILGVVINGINKKMGKGDIYSYHYRYHDR